MPGWTSSELRQLVERLTETYGAQKDDGPVGVARRCSDDGVQSLPTMLVVRELFGLSLGDAKEAYLRAQGYESLSAYQEEVVLPIIEALVEAEDIHDGADGEDDRAVLGQREPLVPRAWDYPLIPAVFVVSVALGSLGMPIAAYVGVASVVVLLFLKMVPAAWRRHR